jgi:hypothetical protein
MSAGRRICAGAAIEYGRVVTLAAPQLNVVLKQRLHPPAGNSDSRPHRFT